MKDKFSLDLSGGLGLVRHQTTDEMRVCCVQHSHERVQGLPVHHSHGLESLLPFLGSSGDTISEQLGHEGHSRFSEQIQTIVVERIGVLGQPITNIVSDNTYKNTVSISSTTRYFNVLIHLVLQKRYLFDGDICLNHKTIIQ